MNRHYQTLELDKILERLAAQTTLADAHELALSLEPQTDPERSKSFCSRPTTPWR